MIRSQLELQLPDGTALMEDIQCVEDIEALYEVITRSDAVTIRNTFIGDVNINEVVESVTFATVIFDCSPCMVDIVAVMQKDSNLMLTQQILAQSDIMKYAGHKKRGEIIAIIEGKSLIRLLAVLAQRMMRITVADSQDEAENFLLEARTARRVAGIRG